MNYTVEIDRPYSVKQAWYKASDADIAHYQLKLDDHHNNMYIDDQLLHCKDINCMRHKRDISRYGAKEVFSLKRISAGTWPCRECATFVSCFFFSTLAHTSLLTGGAIPANRYSSSKLVGLRHPVIDLHASFSSGSSLEACGDLAQTGHAYSAAE